MGFCSSLAHQAHKYGMGAHEPGRDRPTHRLIAGELFGRRSTHAYSVPLLSIASNCVCACAHVSMLAAVRIARSRRCPGPRSCVLVGVVTCARTPHVRLVHLSVSSCPQAWSDVLNSYIHALF